MGYDESTGEAVEFETFDEEMFDEVIEERNQALESTSKPHHFSGDALIAHSAETGHTIGTLHNTSVEEEKKEPAFVDEGPIKPLSSVNEFESAEDIQEDADMSIAMAGFAFFGLVLFAMWYMLRSCKNQNKAK